MAVDLYVGPVSRYIVGDWKNLGQQAAEAHGMQYELVGPGVRRAPTGFFAKRRAAKQYEAWQERTRRFLKGMGETEPMWDDAPEREYATDRPGWEGMSGMIAKYASLLHPEFATPEGVPAYDKLHELPSVRKAAESEGPFRAVAVPTIWFPGSFEPIHSVQWVEGGALLTGSVDQLNAALDQMTHLWGLDRAAFENMATDQPGPEASLDEAALHGLVVYFRLAADAKRRRLPMIVDM